MGKWLCALAALTAVTAVVTSAGAGAARQPCAAPRGYHLLKRTHRAVVVERDQRPRHVYGCLLAAGRMVRLSPYSPIYRLAGRYVAYQEYVGDPLRAGPTWSVDIMDLRRGVLRYGAAVYSYDGAQDDGTAAGKITGLTLKADGAVGWISCPTARVRDGACRAAPARRQVWRSDRDGDVRLDDSPRVWLFSLRRNGSRLSWRHGARTRHARLR